MPVIGPTTVTNPTTKSTVQKTAFTSAKFCRARLRPEQDAPPSSSGNGRGFQAGFFPADFVPPQSFYRRRNKRLLPDIELWRIHHPHQIPLRRRTSNLAASGIVTQPLSIQAQKRTPAPLLLTFLNRHDATSRPSFHPHSIKYGVIVVRVISLEVSSTPLRYANKPVRHVPRQRFCRQLLTGDGQHIFRRRERHLLIMKRQAALLRQIGPRGPTRSYGRPLAGKLFQPLADPFRFRAPLVSSPCQTPCASRWWSRPVHFAHPRVNNLRRVRGRASFTPCPAPSRQASKHRRGRFASTPQPALAQCQCRYARR